jgi:hypothetical protein
MTGQEDTVRAENGEPSPPPGKGRASAGILRHVPTVVGIALAVLGIILTVRSTARAKPVYTVGEPKLVAQTLAEEDRLTLLWDGGKIKNAASVNIAMWNSGSRFIDKSDIPGDNPLRIMPSEPVDILSVVVLMTSRQGLQFAPRVEAGPGGQESIVIGIDGDEALEKGDGAVFHVLFSGTIRCDWSLAGRVKGVPKGFRKLDWHKTYERQFPLKGSNLAFFPFMFCLSALFLVIALRHRKRSELIPGWILFGLFEAFVLIMFVKTMVYELKYPEPPSWSYRIRSQAEGR